MNPKAVSDRIASALPESAVQVDGEDCSFAVTVISNAFHGMSIVSRQRCVLQLFSEELRTGSLHALSVRARTPTEAGLVASP